MQCTSFVDSIWTNSLVNQDVTVLIVYGNYNDLVQQVSVQRNQSFVLWDFKCMFFILRGGLDLDFHISYISSGDATGSTPAQRELLMMLLLQSTHTVHLTSIVFTLSSADKMYSESLHDLTTFNQIFQSLPSDAAFTSLAIHPDGTLLSLGTPTPTIQIYNVCTGVIAASLIPPDISPFTVNALAFSENGYDLLAPCLNSVMAPLVPCNHNISAQSGY